MTHQDGGGDGAKVDTMVVRRKVSVTEGTVMRRINRALATRKEVFKKSRSTPSFADVCDYYVLDVNLNAVIYRHADLEPFAREIGALNEFEELRKASRRTQRRRK